MTRQTYHVNEGNRVRFISGNDNEYIGRAVTIQRFHNSSFGNLVTVKTDDGRYRRFYEGDRLHEILESA